MKTLRFTNILVISLFVIMTSCYYSPWDCIDGIGDVQTEQRVLDNFNEIVSAGSFDVYVTQGSPQEVTVEAQSNLLPYIITEVNGNQLDIKTLRGHCINNTSSVKIYVTCPDISALTLAGSGKIECGEITTSDMDIILAGSGDIYVDPIITDKLNLTDAGSGKIDVEVSGKISGSYVEAKLAGSGDIILAGNVNNSKLTISGSGKIDADAMIQKECEAIISGSGRIYVNVEDYLNVHISGSGDVFYRGNPNIESHITGSGDIRNNN